MQALRDIVACTLYKVTRKLQPGHEPVHSYSDLTYQWEQLTKIAPAQLQSTLADTFQSLVRDLQQPRASLERLEVVIRRTRFVLDFQVPTAVPADAALGRSLTPPPYSSYSLAPSPSDMGPADWLPAPGSAGDGGWMSKAELPRRPFKSRECDFFKQGKCNKEMCNFAHGNTEKDWWTAKYQAMMPCRTPACLGRGNGCIYAHAPEEQQASKREYEDLLAQGGVAHSGGAYFSPYIVAPDVARHWLAKNDLPRPFRSKMCDFFVANGVCTKNLCNYAHEQPEMGMWSSLFQTMFRCNNKMCLGRASGCSYAHSPEEQLASRAKYEETVEQSRAAQRRDEVQSGLLSPRSWGHPQRRGEQVSPLPWDHHTSSSQAPSPSPCLWDHPQGSTWSPPATDPSTARTQPWSSDAGPIHKPHSPQPSLPLVVN